MIIRPIYWLLKGHVMFWYLQGCLVDVFSLFLFGHSEREEKIFSYFNKALGALTQWEDTWFVPAVWLQPSWMSAVALLCEPVVDDHHQTLHIL